MNAYKAAIFSLTASQVVSSQVLAGSQGVDAGQFDIAGVKFGMGSDAAVTAIMEKLELIGEDIEFQAYRLQNPETKSIEPAYFLAKNILQKFIRHIWE